MFQMNDQLYELYRAGLQSTIDVMDTYLCGAERLRTQQIQAIKDNLADHVETVKEIKSADNMETLHAIQTDLAWRQLEKAVAYWNSVCSTANQNQMDIVRQSEMKALEFTDCVCKSLEDAPAGSEPFLSALKFMNDARTAFASCGCTGGAPQDKPKTGGKSKR